MQLPFKIFLLFSCTSFCCTTNEHKTHNKRSPEDKVSTTNPTQTKSQQKSYYSNSDTLTIALKSAVLFQPDSLQMGKRMEKTGGNEFRQGADDYLYYMHASIDYLEKQKLPLIDAKGRKYLSFVSADGNAKIIKIDTLQDLWGIYLFDPNKKPYYADIIEIEDDYKKYFDD